MEVVIIIVAIVNVVTLIVFFVMAANVAQIKTRLFRDRSEEEYIKMAEKEKYIGNKEKAREYLLRARYMYEIENKGCYTEWTVDVSEKLINKVDQLLSEL